MKADQLIDAIKGDTLEINQRNAEAVKHAWAESLVFNASLDKSGLNALPDPDDIGSYPQIFEDWLVKAYGPKFNSESEARQRLHIARDQILKGEGLF